MRKNEKQISISLGIFLLLFIITISIIATIVIINNSEKHITANAGKSNEANVSTTADGRFDYEVLSDGTIEISEYRGTDTTVDIPATIDGKSVTSIGTGAFHGCRDLTKITIPSGVTKIKNHAFYECSSLTSITIPSSVTSIERLTFYGCSSLTSIVIPEGVTIIGASAFEGCSSLTSITIPNSVTNIGDSTFSGCSNLISIAIPEGVTIIGKSAFRECSSLTRITIPNSVTSIGDGTFYGCSSLKSITIPSRVTSIGEWAFYECSSLAEITIPEGVTSIERYAFSKCSSLTGMTIPEGVTSIGDSTFRECSSLAEITIPEGVTSIEQYAFSGCSRLTSITIPSSVTSIGERVFYECSSLTDITIPEGVTSIEASAFYNCNSLTRITIPSSVISIGDQAFDSCGNLANIVIPEGVTSIGQSAFFGCSSLTRITIPSSVTSIGTSAFDRCSSLTSIVIPKGVTSIGDFTFRNCSGLTSITIPEGVTSIGDNAFYGCSNLKSIVIPSSVTRIGNGTFQKCIRLASVTIPNSVTNIGDSTFLGCSSLKSIVIPSSVTSIGTDVFNNCNEVNIICKSNSTAHTYAKENNINYTLDDTKPTVEFSPNGALIDGKLLSAKLSTNVTVTDDASGVNNDTLRYLWTTKDSGVEASEISESFSNGATLSEIVKEKKSYYLWIYAEDLLGNKTIIRSERFYFNQAPTVNVEVADVPSSGRKSVTVSVSDVDNDILAGSEYKYYLSISDQHFAEGEWISYIPGEPFKIGEYDGRYYLFIKTIKDEVGNISTSNGTTLTIDDISCHAFGPYTFENVTLEDTTAPTITSVTGNAIEWTKEDVTLTINATDSESGIATNGYSFDNGLTWQAENTKTYAENTRGIKIAVKDNEGNIATYEQTINIDKIDKTAPTITANPSKATFTDSQAITITLADLGGSGLSATTGQYYLSTSGTELVAVTGFVEGAWKNYTSGTAFTINLIPNGTYYLFVKTVSDNAGNVSSANGEMVQIDGTQYHRFGPYTKQENIAPTITIGTMEQDGNSSWAKTHTETVTIADENSGLALGASMQYGWSTSTIAEPTTWENVIIPSYEAGKNSISFEVTGESLTGKYYLWVKPVILKDTLNNSQNQITKSTSTYWFDNKGPLITASPDSGLFAEPINVEINFCDDEIGEIEDLNTSEQKYYYVSTSSTELIGGEQKELQTENNTATINIDTSKEFYIFVTALTDTLGNISTEEGTFLEINGVQYCRFGPYTFEDVNEPEVTFETNGSATWAKEHTETVTISDEHSGLELGASMQYGWSTSRTIEPTIWEDVSITGYTAGTKSVTFTATGSGLTGKYYLWVKPETLKDTSNNQQAEIIKSTNTYWFDNKGPVITANPNVGRFAEPINVEISFSDEGVGTIGGGSGLNTERYYYVSTSATELVGGDKTPLNPGINIATINPGTSREFYIFVTALTDTLGNISTENGELKEVNGAKYHRFGPYTFEDVNEPEVTFETNGSATWAKTHTETVTIADAESGLALGASMQYGWSTSRATEPAIWKDVIMPPYTAGTKSVTFTATGSGLTGKYYLWVKPETLKDTSNNQQAEIIKSTNTYWFDNKGPVITANPDAGRFTEPIEVEISFSDAEVGSIGVGSNLSTQRYYYVSTSATELAGGYEQALQPENNIVTINPGTSREFYIFVTALTDTLGNISNENGELKEINGAKYHRFGPYTFEDVNKPEVTIETNGNTTWAKEHTETVTIADADSGLALGASMKYGWSTSTTAEPTTWENAIIPRYTAGAESVTFTVTGRELTGKYYLWVKPETLKDTSNNSQAEIIKSTNTYWFDNKGPVITANPDAGRFTEPIEVEISFSDAEVGAIGGGSNLSTQRYYYVSTSATKLVGGYEQIIQESNIATINPRTSGEFYIFVTALTDTLGNISTENGTPIQVEGGKYLRFGPYTFESITPEDTTPPTLEVTYSPRAEEWTNEAVKVTITANEKIQQPTGWELSTDALTLTKVYNGNTTETVTVQDLAGNESTASIEIANIDKTAPTITANPSEATESQSKDVRITIADFGGSGLGATNSYQYYLSTSDKALEEGTWTNYTSANTFTIGEGKTGTYYLFVKQVSDKAENISTINGKPVTINGTTYHQFGPYVFNNLPADQVAPEVTIKTNGNSTWAQTHTETVTIADEHSGLALGASMKYGWSTSRTKMPTTWKNASIPSYTTGTKSVSYEVTGESLTGQYYLWIIPENLKDTVGNSQTANKISTNTYYFDNTKPTVIASPSSQIFTDVPSIIITLVDQGGSGLSATTGEFYLSTSDTGLAGGTWFNYTSGTRIPIPPMREGTYYLFVKTVTDKAGNVSRTDRNGTTETIDDGTAYHIFGPYTVESTTPEDTTPPTLEVTYSPRAEEWTNESVTVTITANEKIQQPTGWELSTDALTLTKVYNGNTRETVTVQDLAGNESTASIQIANIDKTAPTITANPSEATESQSKDVRITIADFGGSGLGATNSYQYYLSKSDKALEEGTWTNYESGITFTIGEGKTGEYYLFVKTVLDNAGNQSNEQEKIYTITDGAYSGTYYKFGPYEFNNLPADEVAPEVTIETNGNSSWAKTHTETVTISDENSGLALGASMEYGWSTSRSTAPTSWLPASIPSYEEGAKRVTFTVTGRELTGKYYLWVKPETLKDASNNSQTEIIKSTNTYWFDNKGPVIKADPDAGRFIGPINVEISFSDAEVGAIGGGSALSTPRYYYISTSATELVGGYEQTLQPENNIATINPETSGEFYIFVTALTDTLGNISTENGTPKLVKGEKYLRFGPYTVESATPEDNTPPTINSVTGNVTEWTKEDVTLTINATDNESGIATNGYSFDNGLTWQIGNTKTYTQNASNIKIKVKDNKGNIATYEKTINIDKIDKTAPTITANPSEATESQSKDVRITIADFGGSGLGATNSYQYYLSTSSSTLAGGEWTNYESGITFTIGEGKTGTYYLFVETVLDNAGNQSNEQEKIYTITDGAYPGTYYKFGPYVFNNPPEDTTPPTINSVMGNVTEWTKEDVTLTINATDNESGIATNGYSFDNGLTWQAQNTKTYTQNTSNIKIKVKDSKGNIATYKETINIDKIDKTEPIITVTPSSATESQSKDVTITIDEEGSGLQTTNSYQYYLSTSSSTLAGGVLTNYTRGSTFTIGEGKTGTYYLFIKTVEDKVGNVSDHQGEIVTITDGAYPVTYHKFGPYKFNNPPEDTTPPTINSVTGNVTEWTKEDVTLTINATDNESGIATNGYSFDNGLTWQAQNTKTYTQNTSNIKIKVKDSKGNIATYKETINIDKIDKTEPIITVTPSSATESQSKDVTITIDEEGSGLPTTNSYQYYLSTSSSTLAGGVLTNYTRGSAFTIGEGKTGTYYLFVKQVRDIAENVSRTNGTLVTINGTTYHKFGPYVFNNPPEDTTPPTVQVTYSPITEEWTNQGVTVTVTANEEIQDLSGWTRVSDKKLTKVYNGNTTERVTVKDLAGNGVITSIKITNIDKTAPSITINPLSSAESKSKDITITVADANSGLSSANSYRYYLSTSNTALKGGTWTNYTSGKSFTIGTEKTGTYYLFVQTIKDKAGNESVAEGTSKATEEGTTYHVAGKYEFDNTIPTPVEEELEVTSNKYTIDTTYITKVQPKTKIEEFKNKLETNATEINVYNTNNGKQEDTQYIGTGMKIQFKLNSEIKTLIVVVRGDVTGDGKSDHEDINRANIHRLNKRKLQAEYFTAGDVTGDGKVRFEDLTKMNRFRLHKISEI